MSHLFGNAFLEPMGGEFGSKPVPRRQPTVVRTRTESTPTIKARGVVAAAILVSAVGVGLCAAPVAENEPADRGAVSVSVAAAASGQTSRPIVDTSAQVGVGLDAETRRRTLVRALEMIRAEGEDPALVVREAGIRAKAWLGHGRLHRTHRRA